MFGNLGEMAKLVQKAKDLQKNMAQLKADLAESEFAGAAAGDAVQAVVSGDFRIRKILISDAVAPDRELLAELCQAAVNQALDNARNAMQQKMAEAAGGVNLPGLF